MINCEQELKEPMQELHRSKVGYIIRDQQGNIVSKRAFQKIPNGRGKKPTWYYFSYTHYMSGMTIYPSASDSIQEIYTYLVNTNDRLGLDKQFCIVPITDDLVNNRGRIISEKLIVN